MTDFIPLPPVLAALSEGRCFRPLEKQYDSVAAVSAVPSVFQRADDQCLAELPPLFFSLASHPDHSGSALFSMGETRISAAISGPYPRVLQSMKSTPATSRLHKDGVTLVAASRLDATLELTLQLAPFATGITFSSSLVKDASASLSNFLSECLEGQSSENEKFTAESQALRSLAEAVMETLRSSIRTENYPNTTIKISVLILSYDRELLYPTIINTVSLALMDARITVSDVLAACVSYVVELPGTPTYCCLALGEEELSRISQAKGEVTTVKLALLTNRRLLAYIDMSGVHLKHPFDQQSIGLAEKACVAIAQEMSKCILDAQSVKTEI